MSLPSRLGLGHKYSARWNASCVIIYAWVQSGSSDSGEWFPGEEMTAMPSVKGVLCTFPLLV